MDSRAIMALCLLLIAAGCIQAPSHSDPIQTESTPTWTPGEPTTTPPADQSPDRLGWEAGYAANDSLAINHSDGLNESELDAVIARTMARVELIRELEFEQPVPVKIIDRATYRNRVNNQSLPSQDIREFENGRAEALFLIGEETDAVTVKRGNRGANVLGYYSANQDQIVLVTNRDHPMVTETVLAHELVHALQYRNFDIPTDRRTLDGRLALRAVIEGDARWLDARYSDRCEGNWSCVTPSNTFSRAGSGSLHFGIYYLQYFPYSDGPKFIETYKKHGGWSRVNTLLAHPPTTTKAVIYPDPENETTVTDVDLPDQSTEAWSPVHGSNQPRVETIGQAGLTAMFAYPAFHPRPGLVVSTRYLLNKERDRLTYLNPFNYNISYVDGWAGDSLRIYRRSDGELGYVWRITWESNDDAAEFATGYRELLKHWGGQSVSGTDGRWRIPDEESTFGDAYSISINNETVTIVNGPTPKSLGQIHEPASFNRT